MLGSYGPNLDRIRQEPPLSAPRHRYQCLLPADELAASVPPSRAGALDPTVVLASSFVWPFASPYESKRNKCARCRDCNNRLFRRICGRSRVAVRSGAARLSEELSVGMRGTVRARDGCARSRAGGRGCGVVTVHYAIALDPTPPEDRAASSLHILRKWWP